MRARTMRCPGRKAIAPRPVSAHGLRDCGPPVKQATDGARATGVVALKILYRSGQATGGELAEMLCIPFGPILAPILYFLKNERLTEVKGAAGAGPQAYQYVLTDAGTARAREAFDKSGYVGPAPVTLGAYVGRVR